MGLEASEDFVEFLQIKDLVNGVSSIKILDIEACEDDLDWHSAKVSFSTEYSQEISDFDLSSHVVVFDCYRESQVRCLFALLNSISSPYIARPLACGTGIGVLREFCFLALPQFSMTFTQFIKTKRIIIDKRRFTEPFIQVVGCVVHGIVAIQQNGFDCHQLEGTHVLISLLGDMITAKIWKFEKGKGKKSSSAWIKLGHLIKSAADQEYLVTDEINDLCDKLINKGLEGLQVLKQSALLTPRQKFENILALNLFIKVNSKDNFASVIKAFPGKKNAIAALKSLMQRNDINWCSKIPVWISSNKEHLQRSLHTGSEFISWLRYIIEHEYLYVPPLKAKEKPSEIQKFGHQPDLEAYVRNSMEELFLQAQNVAADLELEY